MTAPFSDFWLGASAIIFVANFFRFLAAANRRGGGEMKIWPAAALSCLLGLPLAAAFYFPARILLSSSVSCSSSP